MPDLSSQAKSTIQSTLDACTNKAGGSGIPGLVFCAIDKDGKYLTQQVSGQHGLETPKPMTLDTVFWIASCTKMITGIACMQLSEQGKIDLDSSEQLYKYCPELKEKKVLDESGKLVQRKGEITLRMLLTHTAGFGYTFFNERLRDYARPTGYDEFSGDEKDYLSMPLVNQPGSRWEYGVSDQHTAEMSRQLLLTHSRQINIDWAGITVERISGMRLDAYFKTHIFGPLGIKSISFHPDQHMRDNMVTSHQRTPDGKSYESDHPFRRSIWMSDTESDRDKVFNAGGAGCFAKPTEYCRTSILPLPPSPAPNCLYKKLPC